MKSFARRGLSILDSLLSILLLGLVVGATFNFFPISVLSIDRAGHRIQAEALADSSLERWRSRPFAGQTVGFTSWREAVEGTHYQVVVEVFVLPGHDPTRLKGLRSHVEWSDHGGPGRVDNELWISCVTH